MRLESVSIVMVFLILNSYVSAQGIKSYSDFQEPWKTKFTNDYKRALASAENELRSAKARIARTRRSRSAYQRKVSIAMLKSANKKIEVLKKNDPPYFKLLPRKLNLGSYGCPTEYFPKKPWIYGKAIQIIDEDTALVGISYIDDSRLSYDEVIMLKCQTREIVDGDWWAVWDHLIGENGLLEVTGKTTYKTLIGTKTVFVVEQMALIDLVKRD